MLMIGPQTQGTAGTPTHKVTATSIASPDPGLIPSPGTLQLPDSALARLGKGTIEDYAISPDGKYLATVGTMGVFLYQMDTFNQVWGWFYQSGWEYVEFSKGGNLLLVHSYDSYSMLFDVGTGKLLRMVTDGYYGPRGPGGSIAALSPD